MPFPNEPLWAHGIANQQQPIRRHPMKSSRWTEKFLFVPFSFIYFLFSSMVFKSAPMGSQVVRLLLPFPFPLPFPLPLSFPLFTHVGRRKKEKQRSIARRSFEDNRQIRRVFLFFWFFFWFLPMRRHRRRRCFPMDRTGDDR